MGEAMRFAYADQPYLGCCGLYDHYHGDDGRCWDDPETHRLLIERLCDEFPDGWAMSLTSGSLKTLLDFCPDDVRVGGWFKPFAAFKKNVTRAWCWEPVLLRGGRPIPVTSPTVRDWIEAPAIGESITLRRGFTGAKPAAFCFWLFQWFNMQPGDEFVDIFHGSGAVTEAYRAWLENETGAVTGDLFGEAA